MACVLPVEFEQVRRDLAKEHAKLLLQTIDADRTLLELRNIRSYNAV